jgi:LPXTG-motif cell wall-anchored protein
MSNRRLRRRAHITAALSSAVLLSLVSAPALVSAEEPLEVPTAEAPAPEIEDEEVLEDEEFIEDEFIDDEFIDDEFIDDEFIDDEFIDDEFIDDEFIDDEFIDEEVVGDEEIIDEEVVEDEEIVDEEGDPEFTTEVPVDQPIVKVTIYKYVCTSWGAVPRNNIFPGASSALPPGVSVNDLGPATGGVIPPGVPAGCAKEAGWFFVHGDPSAVGMNGTSEVAQTGGVATGNDGAVVFFLSQAESNLAWSNLNGIAISEVRSSSAPFAALRCQGDDAYGDNWEYLRPSIAGAEIVCTAWNVRLPAAPSTSTTTVVTTPVIVIPTITTPTPTEPTTTTTTTAPAPAPAQVGGAVILPAAPVAAAPAVTPAPAALPAASGTLPRTGSESMPLMVGGFGLLLGGLTLTRLSARRRSTVA